MKTEKKNKIIDISIFIGLMLVVSTVTLILFYRQCTGNPQRYHSDMKAYILEMQGLESDYRFPYPIFFKISAFFDLFFGPELAVAVATMVLNSGAMVMTKLAFHHLLLSDGVQSGETGNVGNKGGLGWQKSWVYGALISVASISLFFISMLYTPTGIYLPGIKFRYLGVFTPNPFHNATYMAARPFSILAFLWFVKLLPVYEQGVKRGERKKCWDYILFSLVLLLVTMTKPSFTLVMVSTAGLVMLYRMIRSGFRNFVPNMQLGLCFIPTFIDLLYQYAGVFVPTEAAAEGGVGFGFGDVWSLYSDCIPLAVCLAVGFPILVLILNLGKYRKNTLYLFSWQLFVVSFLEAFLLYEKGFRKPDFNFSWGYMCGIFFCHFGALLLLLEVTGEFLQRRRRGITSTKADIGLLVLQWLAYLCHLICGLLYFGQFITGKMYY